MAAGDHYFDCSNKKISLSAAFRLMIYDDGKGNPVININTNGSTLQPYFNCNNKRSNISDDQLLRLLIVKDENDMPVFNIATS